MSTETRRTTCLRDCPDACSILATVDDGRILRLGGDPSHPITRGFLCYRTNTFLERGPARLTTPLLRRGGRLEPASWDEALDAVARGLLNVRERWGPAAILQYRSGGSLGMSLAVVDYLFERFGPVTVKRGDICNGSGEAAQRLDFGRSDSHDLLDLLHARHVLLWGKNPVVSSPHLVPILRDSAAELVLIDPVWQDSARLAVRFIQPRPGGDFALAMAVAQRLAAAGAIDPEAERYCAGLDRFLALVHSRSLERWCEVAGVAPAEADALAGRLADRPCAIQVGWGLARRANGGNTVRALDALGAISGNLGIPGGGVSYYFARRAMFDTSFATGAAARRLPEPLLARAIAEARDPPIRAAFITAGNPVAMLPDSAAMVRALDALELVVVTDSVLTDTAERAHVVLPCPSFLEADDLAGSYGHHYLGRARPLVAPPEGARSDFDIAAALAPRLGLGELLAGGLEAWLARMVEPRLGPHGVDLAALDSGAVRNPTAPPQLFADRRFDTPSGRVELIAEPAADPPAAEPERPLLLMAASTRFSQSSVWSGEPEGPLPCTVHPAAAAGIADGGRAWLESRIGRLEVVVKHDARQRPDVALVPKGGTLRAGRCANVLLEGQLTDLGEGGALYDQPVRLVSWDRGGTR